MNIVWKKRKVPVMSVIQISDGMIEALQLLATGIYLPL